MRQAKAVITLEFCASTLKRLATPEYGERFSTLFEGVAPEFIPTHAFFFEGKGGRRPVTLDGIKSLEFCWDLPSGAEFDLQIRRGIRGDVHISGRYGGANWISVSLDLVPVMRKGLFDSALRLFGNIIEFTQASHGRASMSYRSTAKYMLADAPELSVPEPPTWNGIVLGPSLIGGPALTCLPRFGAWINVLGREYVELLGRDKLLALDVYSMHEDSAGRIWLQMSERPEQMHLPEVKEHVKKLMDSLNAPDVFCREPCTEHERHYGVDPKEYRTPNFDWSELRDDDPYTTRWYGSGEWIGKTHLNTSGGYIQQLIGKRDLTIVVNTILDLAIRSKGKPNPFGVALAEDDDLVEVKSRSPGRWTSQNQADMIVDRLVKISESRKLKAIGACFYGNGPIPGQATEGTAFKIHLESADGDAYVVYLPFEDMNGKREFGTLVIGPGERVVFFDSP